MKSNKPYGFSLVSMWCKGISVARRRSRRCPPARASPASRRKSCRRRRRRPFSSDSAAGFRKWPHPESGGRQNQQLGEGGGTLFEGPIQLTTPKLENSSFWFSKCQIRSANELVWMGWFRIANWFWGAAHLTSKPGWLRTGLKAEAEVCFAVFCLDVRTEQLLPCFCPY